jgi:uncharacterized protein (DUF2237 family)
MKTDRLARLDQAETRRALERIEADLLAVLRHHAPAAGWPLCAHALIEATGSLAALLVTEAPASRALLITQLDALRLHVAIAGASKS